MQEQNDKNWNSNKMMMNKNRTLSIAKSFIPETSKELYQQSICNGCLDYNREDNLACTLCQDGSYYQKKDN